VVGPRAGLGALRHVRAAPRALTARTPRPRPGRRPSSRRRGRP
jgi:hypothetical protein